MVGAVAGVVLGPIGVIGCMWYLNYRYGYTFLGIEVLGGLSWARGSAPSRGLSSSLYGDSGRQG
jgi:hypothetical protein